METTEYPGGPPYICPSCGSNDWEIHRYKIMSFGRMKILKCKSCGYIDR